jgi:hypothetical protein
MSIILGRCSQLLWNFNQAITRELQGISGSFREFQGIQGISGNLRVCCIFHMISDEARCWLAHREKHFGHYRQQKNKNNGNEDSCWSSTSQRSYERSYSEFTANVENLQGMCSERRELKANLQHLYSCRHTQLPSSNQFVVQNRKP